jgi:quinol-cytochrome oxidoreductase complex cytochrome b subunit
MFVGFIGVGIVAEILAGYLHQGWAKSVGVALVIAAVLSVFIEPYMARRLAGDEHTRRPREVVATQVIVAIVFALAAAAGIATRSILVAGLIASTAVAALSITRR